MRRVSKIQLLLAPVLLAASVGCATPGYLSKCSPGGCETGQCYTSTSADRTQRMMQIASQYEKAGKPELAYKMYQHLHAQDADNTMARERMELIATGDSSIPGAKNKQLQSHEQELIAKEVLAAIEKRKVQDALQAKVSTKATPSSQSVSDIDWDAISARNLEKQLLANSQLNQAKTNSNLSEVPSVFVDEPVVHVERTSAVAEPTWWSDVFDAESNDVAQVEDTSDMGLLEEEVLAEIQPEREPTIIVDEIGIWSPAQEPLADFAVEEVVEPEVVEPEVPGEWAPTSLARYCPDMPSQLHPQIDKLDSSNPEDRIAGLQELRQLGMEAESVNVAVRELMNDSNPLVKAHAAGTLHFITGDTTDSISTLANVLSSEDDEAVRLAAYLLGKVGPAASFATPQLEIVRDSRNTVTSLHAAEALTRINAEDHYSFEKITIALFGADTEARWFAAVSLGVVSEEHSLDAAKVLKEALRDGASSVRAAAALSLGGLGESARIAVNDLQRAAETDNQEVRDAATMALACLEL